MKKPAIILLGLLVPSFAFATPLTDEDSFILEIEGLQKSIRDVVDIPEGLLEGSSGSGKSSVTIVNTVSAKSSEDSDDDGEVEIKVKGSINGQEFEYEKKELLGSQGIHIEIATSSGDGRAQARSIIIIGNDLRGNATTSGLLRALSVTPEDVFDEDDFALLASKVTAENDALAQVELADDLLHIDSLMPAKLFGFIPVTLRPEVTVASTSEVAVRLPWWHIFATKPFVTDDLRLEIEAEVKDSFAALDSELERLADAFTGISNILKSKHDTAKNAIGNVR